MNSIVILCRPVREWRHLCVVHGVPGGARRHRQQGLVPASSHVIACMLSSCNVPVSNTVALCKHLTWSTQNVWPCKWNEQAQATTAVGANIADISWVPANLECMLWRCRASTPAVMRYQALVAFLKPLGAHGSISHPAVYTGDVAMHKHAASIRVSISISVGLL